MIIRRTLLSLFIFFPVMASAHKFVMGQRMTPVSVSDKGEMQLSRDEIGYKMWNSSELEGKVRVIQYIAGRKSAKKKNSGLIKAVKAADLPQDNFQPPTIVNTDDEFPGTGFFVLGKIEKNQRNYPWAQFIIDSNGVGRKTWQLNEGSSTIIVLDKEGRVQWAKDGALTPEEVNLVINLLRQLINIPTS
ncbi:YtfJ family protein [Rahnella woolbedingensis]|uniref:YtfJ family protein n=1 Tax=Rahnella woolbedingensis TaxID=1510574 RepID=A0A419NB74_9GAMM|nr:YtfJ family protein [Rahnella woolbedingensis]RJT45196.1 YtfJ family protein [Rahnella woolbedingensis]